MAFIDSVLASKHFWQNESTKREIANTNSQVSQQTEIFVFGTQALPRATAGPIMAATVESELTTFVVTEGRVRTPVIRRRVRRCAGVCQLQVRRSSTACRKRLYLSARWAATLPRQNVFYRRCNDMTELRIQRLVKLHGSIGEMQ